MTESASRSFWSRAARLLFPNRPPTGTQSQAKRMYQPEKVRLFIKPYCGWCSQAMNWLDDQGIEYDVLDVIADEDAYQEMYRLSGQTMAPVIDVDGKVLADFGERELARFWSRLDNDSHKG